MINCAEYRRAVLADPRDADPQLRLHRDGCRECLEYTQRLLRFEGRLERAMRVSVAAAGAARVVPLRAPAAARASAAPGGLRARRGWLAMAASVLIVVAVAGGLWLAAAAFQLGRRCGGPHGGGAAGLGAHRHTGARRRTWRRRSATHICAWIPGQAWSATRRSCQFRGHRVPHLVVQTEMGPVTVMVLAHESVSKPEPFDEQGYRGVILPVPGRGSLAVLARGRNPSPDMLKQIASRVQDALVWTGLRGQALGQSAAL